MDGRQIASSFQNAKMSFVRYDEFYFLAIVNVCAESLWGWSSFISTYFKMFQFWWKEHYCVGKHFDGKVSQYFRYCSETRWQFIKTCMWRKWPHFKDACRCRCRYCCLFPERQSEQLLKSVEKILFAFCLLPESALFNSLKAVKYLLDIQLLFEEALLEHFYYFCSSDGGLPSGSSPSSRQTSKAPSLQTAFALNFHIP